VTLAMLPFLMLALIGLVLSAVFSGLETGLYTINRVRLAVRVGAGDARARKIREQVEHPRRMLATLLIGNNIANYASSFGFAVMFEAAGISQGRAIVFNALLLIPLLFIVGEILPKDLFRTHTDRWTYALSGFLVVCERVFFWTGLAPLVLGFVRLAGRRLGGREDAPRTARQRMIQLIREGAGPGGNSGGAGALSERQTSLADRALTMRQRTVGEEMIPWSRVATLAVDADRSQREIVMRHLNYSRLPVVDRNGKVVGVLTQLDALMEPDRASEELMQPLVKLAPHTPIRSALRTLRHEHRAMAIVEHSPTGQPAGIVTLKDLVEPLTGELVAW